MKVAVFSTQSYDRPFLEAANAAHGHQLVFFEARLTRATTPLAAEFAAVLLTFPNVIITGHQAFFAQNALASIAETTLANIAAFERGTTSGNELSADQVVR